MSDVVDWKEKYRDSIREMEGAEKSWRKVEQALRRLAPRPLTRLANRKSFDERFAREIGRFHFRGTPVRCLIEITEI